MKKCAGKAGRADPMINYICQLVKTRGLPENEARQVKIRAKGYYYRYANDPGVADNQHKLKRMIRRVIDEYLEWSPPFSEPVFWSREDSSNLQGYCR